MKKYVLLLGMIGIMPVFMAGDSYGARYTSSCTNCGHNNATGAYKASGGTTSKYGNTITNNFYYTQPVGGGYYQQGRQVRNTPVSDYYTGNRRSADAYNNYERPEKKVTRSEKSSYASQTRKYFLAHPFFQPTEGRFGSVTDLSYANNNFDFDMLNVSVQDIDPASPTYGQALYGPLTSPLSGKQETTQLAIKQDFSYGITDDFSVLGMVQYDQTEVSLKDWSDGSASDTLKDSGVNIFGLGLQYRFIDDDEWIAMLGVSYQYQKDTANSLILGVKAGYKINRSTVYGLARLGYSKLKDGDTYGAYVSDKTGDWLMLSYKRDVSSVVYAEGGVGVFSVLNKYITLNGELVYGSYDWHNQLNLKGIIGFQPADSFALNFYASTALYDSADGKVLKYMNYDKNPTEFPRDENGNPQFINSKLLYSSGDYKIKEYSEWKVGVQAVLYF